jgi:hypothetical protein
VTAALILNLTLCAAPVCGLLVAIVVVVVWLKNEGEEDGGDERRRRRTSPRPPRPRDRRVEARI